MAVGDGAPTAGDMGVGLRMGTSGWGQREQRCGDVNGTQGQQGKMQGGQGTWEHREAVGGEGHQRWWHQRWGHVGTEGEEVPPRG